MKTRIFHKLYAGERPVRLLISRRALQPGASRRQSHEGFTLVELMVAMSIIGLVAGSSIFALLDSNRFATIDRLRTAAKAACQEAIDKALTTPYAPPDVLPALFTVGGVIPAPSGSPDRGTLTTSENISLYIDQLTASQVAVPGTRTTRASLSDSTMGLVRVLVRVDYSFQNKAYSHEMYVVRGPD